MCNCIIPSYPSRGRCGHQPESQISLCHACAYLLPVLFIVRRYCRHVFAAGWLAFPLTIISILLTSGIFMLCNTHVLYGLRVRVLHSLREARMIRCNCISIAVAIGAARAAMAAPVFAMKKMSVPVSKSRNTRLVGRSPTTRLNNTHVVHTHMCCSSMTMTSKACRGQM